MAETLNLPGTATPAAHAALEAMLAALQGALRIAMARGPAAAEEEDFWASVEIAYSAYDRWLALVVSAHPMRCRAGCSACCRDNPRGVAGVEALRLARALRADGAIKRVAAEVHEAATTYEQACEALGRQEAGEAQRAQGRPCPLLGAGGFCTAYQARPVACRMFYATTPPEWCSPEDPNFGVRVNPNLVPPAVCRQILGAISHCLGLPAATNLWEGLDAAISSLD